MIKKLLFLLFAILPALAAYTQTDSAAPAPALTVTGSVDMYYKYDFGQTRANNLTSFTNSQNSFELGMATVKLEHKTSKLDVVADLGFGKRAREFSYTDDNDNAKDIIFSTIKQLYISYSPAAWVKLTAGTWATHVGYEVVDAYANRNYSMSYMFTNGPFSHTGVKADFTAGKSGFMIGISNPTDYKYVPDDVMNRKYLIAQYSYLASDYFKLYLNYVMGKGIDTAKSHQFDLVLTSKLSDKFSLAYNGTISTVKSFLGHSNYESGKNWGGSALYINYDPTTHFGLTLRGEYFSDKNQLKVYSSQTEGGSVFATTLSANLRVSSFVLIPEIRIDHASKNIFVDKDNKTTQTAANVLVAAVYQF
jgi:hypothetical protein